MPVRPVKLLRSIALIVGLVLIAWFGVLTRLDWWLFYLHHGAPVRDVGTVHQRLVRSGFPILTLGQVQYDGQQWPLEAVSIKRANARRQVCIVGGIHGNEPAGTETALSLIDTLAHDPSQYPDSSFTILPLANPWGWAHDTRHNGDNQDIARHFVAGSAAETALIKSLLAQQACNILIDLHEDRLDPGFYVLTYENPNAGQLLAVASTVAADTHIAPSRRAPNGIMHIVSNGFAKESRTTLSLYAREHGTPWSYIIESPERKSMAQRVQLQREWVDRLIHVSTLTPSVQP